LLERKAAAGALALQVLLPETHSGTRSSACSLTKPAAPL